MGIKLFWAIALQLAIFSALSGQNKDYLYYTVREGETVEGIAKSQKIDRAAIDRLNPEVRYGLKAGMILLLPKAEAEDRSGSRQAEAELPAGETSPRAQKPVESMPSDVGAPNMHTVVSGDTWYSLSKKWGCTVEQAMASNPGVEVLKLGTQIKVCDGRTTESSAIPQKTQNQSSSQQNAKLHTVVSGETLYGLSKRYQTTVEQIKLWNGGLAEGLKPGQVIQVGVDTAPEMSAQANSSLASAERAAEILPRSESEPLRVALILPFSQKSSDSTATAKLRQQEQKVASFYAGVLMAVDSMRKGEMKVDLRVFDDADRKGKLDSLLADPFIRDAHFVLGPLYGHSAVAFAKAHRGWVVSPMSLQIEDEKLPNLIDLMPGEEERLRSLAEWIRWSGQGGRLILVSESEKGDIEHRNKLALSLKQSNFSCDTFRYSLKTGISASLSNALSGPETPLVVALSKNRGLIEALAGKLGTRESPGARLVCLNELDQINLYDKQKLVKAKLSIVRSIDLDRDLPHYKPFVRAYKSRFRNEPDVFSFQGHDSFWMACHAFMDGTPEGGDALEGFQIGWKLSPRSGSGFDNVHAHMVGLKDWEWERIY